jgi:hypothetical protein
VTIKAVQEEFNVGSFPVEVGVSNASIINIVPEKCNASRAEQLFQTAFFSKYRLTENFEESDARLFFISQLFLILFFSIVKIELQTKPVPNGGLLSTKGVCMQSDKVVYVIAFKSMAGLLKKLLKQGVSLF